MEKRLRLYRLVELVTFGVGWEYCRDVTPETRDEWVAQYQADEPDHVFTVLSTSTAKFIPLKEKNIPVRTASVSRVIPRR